MLMTATLIGIKLGFSLLDNFIDNKVSCHFIGKNYEIKKFLEVLTMKLFIAVAIFAAILSFVACADDNQAAVATGAGPQAVDGITTIRIGATPRPHMEILQYIQPYLLEDGVALELVEFTDFFVVNPAVADGTLDANYFQHTPFLNASPYADVLYMMGLVHIEPMGLYSLTMTCMGCLPDGGVIAIPNDATNGGRALLLLEANGIIELDPAAGILATPFDITHNPRNIQFHELDAALLPRLLEDPTIDAAIINTNHVLAGTDLSPMYDSILIESHISPYGNGLAIRRAEADNPAFITLLSHLQSERVRQFIYDQYGGAVVPVF